MRQLNHLPSATRPAPGCPNPETITAGSHHINLTRADLGDPALRLLQGRHLRYWLLNHLNKHPDRTHRVADLVTSILEAGFTLNGRASKTMSDALATETARGRITRTGWGQYILTRLSRCPEPEHQPQPPTPEAAAAQQRCTIRHRRLFERSEAKATRPNQSTTTSDRSPTKRAFATYHPRRAEAKKQSRWPNGKTLKTTPTPRHIPPQTPQI